MGGGSEARLLQGVSDMDDVGRIRISSLQGSIYGVPAEEGALFLRGGSEVRPLRGVSDMDSRFRAYREVFTASPQRPGLAAGVELFK